MLSLKLICFKIIDETFFICVIRYLDYDLKTMQYAKVASNYSEIEVFVDPVFSNRVRSTSHGAIAIEWSRLEMKTACIFSNT